jgi:formylglycine-generating enzyme required for sulfatase activity
MNTRQTFVYGILAAFIALAITACSNPAAVTTTTYTNKPAGTKKKNTDTVIAAAAVTITGPATGSAPVTTAATTDTGYTCGGVSWTPNDNLFKGNTVYTATVTLTANERYTFTGLTTATINAQNAAVANNTGAAVTLSLAFAATSAKTVTAMSIKTQPATLTYTHGDTLNLSGLAVTLAYNDSTSEDVALADFTSKNISTNPANGATLSYTTHNAQPVMVTYGGETVNTNNLTVNKANPTVTWPTGLTGYYGFTLAHISLPGNGSGSPAGMFTWTTLSTLAGELGTQSHNMTFMPTDTTNYNTVTQNVNIHVGLVEMVNVNGGSFQMGKNGDGTVNSVTPVHEVTLAAFSIGKYEVTQKQWHTVMGTTIQQQNEISDYHGLDGVGDNYPMYHVSWYEALVFCNKLSVLEGLTPAYRIDGKTNTAEWGTVPTSSDATWNAVEVVSGSTGYRLPTEAQWEYAAKGGPSASDPYKIYSGSDTVGDVAWYSGNNGSSGDPDYGAKQVGTKAANELGIHDMSGNVWEWCWDWYAAYEDEAQTDPVGASSGSARVARGGSLGSSAELARSAYRNLVNPTYRYYNLGFRVLRPAP